MALRWKAYAPNTILKAVEVQDLADNGVVQVDAAADLASADLVNANVTFVTAEHKVYTRVAAGIGADKWKVFSGGLPGLGGWADITATTGSPTKHEYTDANGTDWTAYEFTGDGTLNVSKEGLLDYLIVGGGGGAPGAPNTGGGGGGGVSSGLRVFAPGSYQCQVAPGATWTVNAGASSIAGIDSAGGGIFDALGGVRAGLGGGGATRGNGGGTAGGGARGDGSGATPGSGYVSSISGAPVEYGKGGFATGVQPAAHTGGGASGGGAGNESGSSGVVIVRVPRANALA